MEEVPGTLTASSGSKPVADWFSSKISADHLDRLAVVYIRQSTLQQVQRHRESTEVQYNMRSLACSLGWHDDRILVIDQDLGQSGASVEGRLGFQRLVAEVSLGHVGVVMGVEMSRLARSCKDWYQLLELCSLYGTLIADLDGIYDPSQYSDRLVLGLKGTMSEAELHVLRMRLNQGRLNKARRGALYFLVPIGYVRRPSGDVALDPDLQVQEVVRLVFRKFAELGTINAVLRFLVVHKIQLGVRVYAGPNRGDLEWRRPCRATLNNMLHNPIYAGAYVYARRPTDPRRRRAGRPSTGRTTAHPGKWQVCLKDRLPAYISWEQFENNVARLRANSYTASERGAPKNGAGLLSGLLVCGRCGYRMAVHYNSGAPRYTCCRLAADYGEARCQQLSAKRLDAFVSDRVLEALTPASLQLSMQAATLLENERAELDRIWQQRLERAKYEAERSARQYRAVEPENRLVAKSVESDWEEKLRILRVLQEEYSRFSSETPRLLTADERARIEALATDIPRLWKAFSTTNSERKEILREIIETVRVVVHDHGECVDVEIRWVGGSSSSATITRPVATWEQMARFPEMLARMRELFALGKNLQEIADLLHQEGWRPPKRRDRIGVQCVRRLAERWDLRKPGQRRKTTPSRRRANEWTIAELARQLDMPAITLHSWIRHSTVQARKSSDPRPCWLIWADDNELQRLRALRARPPGQATRDRWLSRQDVGGGET